MNCKKCIHKDVCMFRNPTEDEKTCACFKDELDVVEAKRGEWSIAIGYDIRKKVKCSVCELMNYEPTAHCPHCGAQMDGGNTE